MNVKGKTATRTVIVSVAVVLVLVLTSFALRPPQSPSAQGPSPYASGLASYPGPKVGAVTENDVNGEFGITTSNLAVSQGDAVYVSACLEGHTSVSVVRDNEWVTATREQSTQNPTSPSSYSQYTFVIANVNASQSFTVSLSFSAQTSAVVFTADITGVDRTSPVDAIGPGHAGAAAASGTFADTLSTSRQDDLGLLSACSENAGGLQASLGSTLLAQGSTGGNGATARAGLLVQGLPTPGGHSIGFLAAPGALTDADSIAFAPPAVNPNFHPIQHVVIIPMENQQITQIWGNGPYERYLAATFGNDSTYYSTCTTTGNYLAMVAAVTNQCGNDLYFQPYTNTSLADTLTAKGYTWADYAESLSNIGGTAGACLNPNNDSGAFVQRHVPFLHFANVTKNPATCTSHILDASLFNQSVATGHMLNFSFYSPNLCDDGHQDCTAGVADSGPTRIAQVEAWLRGFLAPMLNGTGIYAQPAARAEIAHTAFLLVYDRAGTFPLSVTNAGFAVPGVATTNNGEYCSTSAEVVNGGNAANTVCGGNVYMTIVSPYSRGLHTTVLSSHYSVASTVEWLFNLSALNNVGHYDSDYWTTTPGFPALATLFSFPENGY